MIVDPATTQGHPPRRGGKRCFCPMRAGFANSAAISKPCHPAPGSAQRHWHSAEGRLFSISCPALSPCTTMRARPIPPGDAVCWRHGDPNAHHLTNRGDTPARYIILGSRAAGNMCTYPTAATDR